MEVRPDEVSENSNPDTIVNWDSLKHMSLILALEETFDIRFDEEAILSMLTLKEIILKVAEYTKTEQHGNPSWKVQSFTHECITN